jgi:predicted nucleotidyltransferase
MAKRVSRQEVFPKEIVIKRLKEKAYKISKLFPLTALYLYGSYANGKPTSYSDVDVAVFSPAFGNNIIHETAILMEIFEETGLMVEPRVYSSKELEEAEKGTFLYEEVLKNGLRIY